MAKDLIRILDGNAFKLRIKGQVKTIDFTEDADFDVVRNLIVNFVRRGREAQEYAIDDSGRIVAENSGNLSRGIYGVELRGYYNGKPWRFYERDVFVIVDEYDESESGIDDGDIPLYDVTFEVSFGGDGVSAAFVEAAVNTHNSDEESHPHILSNLSEKVHDVEVNGVSVIEEVTEDGKTKKVAKINLTGVTDAIDGLQGQINDIVAGKAQVSLAASPSLVYVGQQSTIQLTASSDTVASEITISGGNLQNPITGSGKSLSANDVITPSGNTSYAATFVIAGTTKTATRTVTAVRPVYYGAGASAEAASNVASIRTSPAGTYNVTVDNDGSYIYWVVPNTMSISGATMNGFDFPLDAPESIVKDGVAYKAYRSSNTIDAGTHTIIIK